MEAGIFRFVSDVGIFLRQQSIALPGGFFSALRAGTGSSGSGPREQRV